MSLAQFIDEAKYKNIAVGGFDAQNVLKYGINLQKINLDIKYLIVNQNLELKSIHNIPIITWNELQRKKFDIDVILFFESYIDSVIYSSIILPFKIDLIDINSFFRLDAELGKSYEEINKKIQPLGVTFVSLLGLTTYRLKQPSEREIHLGVQGTLLHDHNEPYLLSEVFNDLDYADENYIKELIADKATWDRRLQLNRNHRDKYFNSIEGMRYVPEVPKDYDNTIYLFGICFTKGVYAEDKNTIAAYLQKKMNGFQAKTFRVVSIIEDIDKNNVLSWIDSINFKPGDYIVSCVIENRVFSDRLFNYFKKLFSSYSNIICEDTLDYYERVHVANDEIFIDNHHVGHKGYKMMAEYLYEKIIENSKKDIPYNQNNQNFQKPKAKDFNKLDYLSDNKDFQNYLLQLKELKKKHSFDKIGAIVVNCNPFTNGHRYLIETSSKKVDFLYVFVVEEDKSEFSFKDRLSLVKRGIKDLNNVLVLPSGKFIISNYTFPGYFMKEDVNPIVDPSLDVEIFATFIAPSLGINTRFVGDEPYCKVTKMYNETMSELLPRFNIDFIEIKRMENDGTPISASLVRKLLNNNDFQELEKIIPKSTYAYLMKTVR